MPAPKDLIHETTTSIGTGNLTVAAVNGKVRFSDATHGFGTGDNGAANPIAFISHRSAAEWEICPVYMSAANTMVRGTPIASSNANNAVNFSAGTKDVLNDLSAFRQLNQLPEVSVASAATTNIFAARSDSIFVTGTDAITAFDTAPAGVRRFIRFEGALTLTHHATSLIIPGAANITTAANDRAIVKSLGSGNALIEGFVRASGKPIVANTPGEILAIGQGKHLFGCWAAGEVLRPTTTPANALTQAESSTNKVNYEYIRFPNASTTYIEFSFRAPKSSDESGTFDIEIEWTEQSGASAHVCRWQAEMQAQGDADTIDSAWGTAVAADDTGSSGTRRFVTLAAITPGGTWAEGDALHVRLARLGGHANDTLDVGADFIRATVFGSINAANDA